MYWEMLTLAIDTSTNVLSVALVCGAKVLGSVDECTNHNQSEILMSRIALMMSDCHLKPADLEKIAVAVGPGSYTGIRVGVAAAKSLAYALAIPVVGVSSLEVMAMAAVSTCVRVAMIDARRTTVFASAYDVNDKKMVSDGHYTLSELLSKLDVGIADLSFVGDGAVVHQDRLLATWSKAQIVSEFDFKRCKAEVLAELAMKGSPQDNVHRLVPNYLRQTEAELNVGG